jgi:uncharacterized protein YwgA
MSNEDKSLWALSIVDIAQSIEGITRFQKYAFLVSKKIKDIVKHGFYNDWIAGDYGPFSKNLMENIHNLINDNSIKSTPTPNQYGYNVEIITITDKGKEKVKEFKEKNSKFIDKLQKIIEIYQPKRLIDILHDVYFFYPKYAIQSKIRDIVEHHNPN